MAILRGGVRIGGFDIRLGLPRDRSLDNVESDPRFRQKAGGNPETTIGRVQSYINEAEGFARKARFYVEFNLPKAGGAGITNVDTGAELSDGANELETTFKSSAEMIAVQKANARRVQAFCSAISMPERTIEMKEVKHHGPAYKIAIDYKSTDITATFYCDKFVR